MPRGCPAAGCGGFAIRAAATPRRSPPSAPDAEISSSIGLICRARQSRTSQRQPEEGGGHLETGQAHAIAGPDAIALLSGGSTVWGENSERQPMPDVASPGRRSKGKFQGSAHSGRCAQSPARSPGCDDRFRGSAPSQQPAVRRARVCLEMQAELERWQGAARRHLAGRQPLSAPDAGNRRHGRDPPSLP